MVTPMDFMEGDLVEKRRGYRFPGVVVSVFMTQAGARRVVVEADDPNFAGMLHIFGDADLVPRAIPRGPESENQAPQLPQE